MIRYILLVGEGNFSYAASLSMDLDNVDTVYLKHYRLIATDLKPLCNQPIQTEKDLTLRNIQIIESYKGNIVFKDVDATKLEEHTGLLEYVDLIDKIIFNFPHVKTKKMHIGANRDLLKKFFISANKFINQRNNVKILVSLCSGQSGVNSIETKSRSWADSWQIVEQAAYGGFVLSNIQKFSKQKFYTNSGYKDRSNASFNAEEANTFTFVPRETLSPDVQLQENTNYQGFIEPLLNLEFLRTLSETNPLITLINLIGKLGDLKLSTKIEYKTLEHPFVHLWVDDLEVLTLQKLHSSEIHIMWDNDKDSVLNYNNKNVGQITHGKICLNLTKIVIIKYNIIDSRILFSKYCYLNTDDAGRLSVCTGSLFPIEHKWDISFWIIGPNFNTDKFIECSLIVYGLLLKSVKLMEVYTKPSIIESDNNDTDILQVSYCYRITIQSLDIGISRIRANEFHSMFRKVLDNKLDVKLR